MPIDQGADVTDQQASSPFTDTPPRPAFDVELLPLLNAVPAIPVAALTPEMLPMARERMLAEPIPGVPKPDLTVDGLVTVEERTVAGPDGTEDLVLLILRPAHLTGPVAGIFHVHGGGMFMGDRTLGVGNLLSHVADGNAVVVSVEYRLAPEHPAPGPVEDCYAGLVWTARHAPELGIDPERLLIHGSSAGGGLAAGTALLARDRGFPVLSHQILTCPMLDDRLRTPSSRMLDGEGIWDRNLNLFGWSALLGDRRGGADVSMYSAPARAEDLTGLPRTYIDTGSAEIFRDEIIDFASRLSLAGVTVDLHMWGGAFHGFDQYVPHAALSRASLASRDEYVRRAIER